MRHFFIRSQLVFVSVILFITLAMTLSLVLRYNQRWDFTKEKIYSLSEPTAKLLEELALGPLEVLAFYPHDDPARGEFEIFLRECQLHHPHFRYGFYDPDRVPRLARKYHIKEIYTVILKTKNQQERILRPTEESFTNALLRLAHPKITQLCFVTGHDEAALSHEDRNGLRFFRDTLESANMAVTEIILSRDKVPTSCHVLIVAGPHRDLDPQEFQLLKQAFHEGKGVFFLLDPMDPGAGTSFQLFMKDFGIVLGADVVVDKMSRMIGGDFLVPLISQYVSDHPITGRFRLPTFFTVARSVQPGVDDREGIEVIPLAMSGSGSWAETNLVELEKGKATFEPASDVSGPITMAVAAEGKKEGGRMVVVGDSDFVTNAYLHLSGNQALAVNMVQWLAKDDRFIEIKTRHPEFKPLLMSPSQRATLFLVSLVGFPFFFLALGTLRMLLRKRSSV